MSIIDIVNEWNFIKGFDEIDRSENFTRPARVELFRFYDDLSEDTGEDIEYDPIAICCDWSEYTEEELVDDFGEPRKVTPNQYRYIINLNERGYFAATIYSINEDGKDVWFADITGSQFREGSEFEGIEKDDGEGIIDELLGQQDKPLCSICLEPDDEPKEEGDTLEDVLNRLEDETTVLQVEHYGGEDTYLVMAH